MTAPIPSRRLKLRERLYFVDIAILALAFTSLLVFLLFRTNALPDDELVGLRVVDFVLVGLYAGSYIAKGLLADDPLKWLRRNWLFALGAFPLTIPFLIPARFFIVVQVIIVTLRTGEALDRAFGARVLQGLFVRYRSMLVEELTDPILLRLAIALEEALVSRDFAKAIAKRLDERRDLVEQAVDRAIAASPKLSRLNSFPGVSGWIDDTREEMVDAAHAALSSPEVNQLIREGLQDAFAELKTSIKERKYLGKGVGVGDVAAGVVRVGE